MKMFSDFSLTLICGWLLLIPHPQSIPSPSRTPGRHNHAQVLNPLLFGGSDLGDKINTAVAACKSSSCVISIPHGKFVFSTPIVLRSNLELIGAGKTLTHLIYVGRPSSTAITAGTSTSSVGIRNFDLRGAMEQVGVSSSYNDTFGISLSGTHSTVDNVRASHFWGYGGIVNISGSHNTISNSDLEYGTFCLGLSGSYQTASNNYLSNHYSEAASAEKPAVHYWDGIVSEGLTYSQIERNTVEDNGQSGIYEGGNGSFSSHNSVINNIVRRNWNRGIDSGVTGDESPSNEVSFLTVLGNIVTDNLADNIWLICVQHANISANRTEYTSAYSRLFKSFGTNTRSGIVIADICGTAPQDTSSDITVTDNQVLADQKDSIIGLNFNVKPTSERNSILRNTSNARLYIGPTVTRRTNTIQTQ